MLLNVTKGKVCLYAYVNATPWRLMEDIYTYLTWALDWVRKKLVKCYVWSIALYGAETWTLRAVD